MKPLSTRIGGKSMMTGVKVAFAKTQEGTETTANGEQKITSPISLAIGVFSTSIFDVSTASLSNMPPAQMEVFRMKVKRAAVYARVSTGEQNTDVQERSLRDYVNRRGWQLQKIYRDKGISGTKSSRPALDELMKDCRRRSIDVVVVWKFDRFARSLKTLISALENFRALGIDFVSVTEAVDTSLPAGEMLFQMIGAVAQFERSLIAERVRAGLDHARKNGAVLGRPALRILTKKEIVELRRQRIQEKLPYRTLASKFGVSVWSAHTLCGKAESR
jgi:DNA invertase Pin-like site-specific DNA recombinase